MDSYLLFKLLHIISSTVLFGTGLGTAFYMWRADQSGDVATVAAISKNVVLADWIFTTPAVIVQPLTGFAMLWVSGLAFTTSWVLASIVLYIFVGCCWLPVVWIQMKIHKGAEQALVTGNAYDGHQRYMKVWYSLGWCALAGMLAIFYLMVFKPVI